MGTSSEPWSRHPARRLRSALAALLGGPAELAASQGEVGGATDDACAGSRFRASGRQARGRGGRDGNGRARDGSGRIERGRGRTGESAWMAAPFSEPSMKAVPASSFVMGSEENDAEKPPHKVELSPYRMCDHLVTNEEYSLFVSVTRSGPRTGRILSSRDENYLSDWDRTGLPRRQGESSGRFRFLHAAGAFAAWAGKRLPDRGRVGMRSPRRPGRKEVSERRLDERQDRQSGQAAPGARQP